MCPAVNIQIALGRERLMATFEFAGERPDRIVNHCMPFQLQHGTECLATHGTGINSWCMCSRMIFEGARRRKHFATFGTSVSFHNRRRHYWLDWSRGSWSFKFTEWIYKLKSTDHVRQNLIWWKREKYGIVS